MTGPAQLIDDCFLHDKDRLRHDDALSLLRERLSCVVGTQSIELNGALGRVLAADVDAPHPVPMHTNAAVDGYAFRHASNSGHPISISQTIAAGDLEPISLEDGTAARIFTGAPMPPGADTVAMQEDCNVMDAMVTIPPALKAGANCRQAGEDLQTGDRILQAGTRLQAADLAALASVGQSTIQVFSKLQLVIFSSGNELRSASNDGPALRAGEVYDANTPLLTSLLQPLPVTLTSGGIIADDGAQTFTAIQKASQTHDVIITTGGASRGAEDHMLSTLDALGKRHLWQLAVKPGRPMMFGQIPRSEDRPDCLFFGLPGNPVAAMVCFLLYVRPALLKLGGARWQEPIRYPLPADFEITGKKPDRREFLRGILKRGDKGELCVSKFQRDGSGLISSLREADGLIEIEEDTVSVARGSLVSFLPFSSFL